MDLVEVQDQDSAAPSGQFALPQDEEKADFGAPDDSRALSQGIRKLSGDRLTLYTDLAGDDEIVALVRYFDQAWPQWCRYFGRPDRINKPWHAFGYLMGERARFEAAGLLSPDVPAFQNGFSRDTHMWWYEQPTPYYRRHLMLHEGTHAFMFSVLGDCGPPWYMEGMAELLATHRVVDGQVQLGWFPSNRKSVPYWGRIRLVRDAMRAASGLSLEEIFEFGPRAHLQNESYGWCWAVSALLDGHPRYRERFRQLPNHVGEADFNKRFRELFVADWSELNEEWQVFASSLEYGYDLTKAAIEFAPGMPMGSEGAAVTIAVDRGWQSSGVRLEAGKVYRISAQGRYQVNDQPRIWWCEPGGVSIRYHGGRPVGILLAAVRPEPSDPRSASALVEPQAVGLETEISPPASGTLYLKINDSPADLGNNAGTLSVRIERQ